MAGRTVPLFTVPQVTPAEMPAALAGWAARFDASPDDFVAVPIGLMPLPRPRPDGRAAPGTPKALLAHPVFWFDADVVERRDGEPDAYWLARVWLELANAGCVDPGDGSVVDALLSVGVDVETEDGERRVRRFLAGGFDAELAGFVIPAGPPPDGRGDDWAEDEAISVVATLASEWEDLLVRRARQDAKKIADALARVTATGFERVISPFVAAAEQYRAGVSNGARDERVFWAGFEVSLDRLRAFVSDTDVALTLAGAQPSSAISRSDETTLASLASAAIDDPSDQQLAAIAAWVRSAYDKAQAALIRAGV